jgi:outer membrane protein TolC
MISPLSESRAIDKPHWHVSFIGLVFFWFPVALWASPVEEEAVDSPRALYALLRKIAKDQSLVLQKEDSEAKILELDQAQLSYQSWPLLELSGSASKTWPDSPNNQIFSAKVNYKLYDFGRLAAREKSITLERELKSLKKDLHLEEFSWQAAQQIIKIQSAYLLWHVQKTILETSESKQKILNDNVRKGLRPLYDLKLSELERYNHRLSLAKAQSELDLSLADYSNFLRQWFPADRAEDIDEKTKKSLAKDPFSGPVQNSRKNSGGNSGGSSFINRSPDGIYDVQKPDFWLTTVRSWNKHEDGIQEKIRDASRSQTQSESEFIKADQLPELFLNLEANYGGKFGELSREYKGQIGMRWVVPWRGKTHLEEEKIAEKTKLVDIEYTTTKEKQINDYEKGVKELENLVEIWSAQDALYKARKEVQRLTEERQKLGAASTYEVAQATLDLSNIVLDRIKTAHRSQEIALQIAHGLGLKKPEMILNPKWSSSR